MPSQTHAARKRGRPPRLVTVLVALALGGGCLGTTGVAPAHADALIRTIGCGDSAVVLNTGYNGAGGKLGTGALDPVWLASGPFQGSFNTGLPTTWSTQQVLEITADPTSASGGIVFIDDLPTQGWTQAYVTSNSMVVPSGFSTAATVISQTANGRAILGWVADYAYMVQFNLAPEVAPSGVEIRLTLLADNSVAAVYVNGIAQTGTHLPQSGSLDGRTPYDYSGYTSGNASIATVTGFRSGLNTILVQVKTSTTSAARPTTDQQFMTVSSQGVVVCNPVIVRDEVTTLVNTATTIAVMDNDGNLPDGAKVSQVVGGDSDAGTWVLNPDDNSVTFTPTPGFLGAASATYTVTSSDNQVLGTATASVMVDPLVTPDAVMTSSGAAVSVPVLANDIVWPSATVGVVPADADQGVWSVDDGNVVHFTPAPGFAGTASATYTVTSPGGVTAEASVTVEVLGLSLAVTPPQAEPDAAGQTVQYTVTMTNTSAVPLTAAGLSVGEFSGRGDPPVVACTADEFYVPVPNPTPPILLSGADAGTADPDPGQPTQAADAGAADTGSAAETGELSLPAGASATCTVTYTLTQADLDAGDDLALDLVASAQGGPADHLVPATASASAAGVALAQHPELTVAATSDPIQAVRIGEPVVFEVTVTNTGNVTLDGVGVDSGQFNGAGGKPVVGSCAYAASVPGDTTPPADNGSLRLAPGGSATCLVTYAVTRADVDAGGALSFVADAAGADPAGEPVTAHSAPSRVAIVELAGSAVETPWNTPVGVDVLGGIQHLPAGSTLAGLAAGDPAQADWWAIDSHSGEVTFTPPPTFSGVATTAATVRFPDGSTSVQQVTVTVRPPAVTAADTSGAVKAGSSVTLSPAITAPAGSQLRVDGPASQGTWTVNQTTRTIAFTPADGFLGQATATLTVTAPDGTSGTARLSADVTAVPSATDASATVPQGQSVTLRPQLVVPDGSDVSVAGVSGQGAWTRNQDNSVTFTPADGFVGAATATIQITGPDGMTDTAQLTVQVTPIPIVDDVTQSGPQGAPVVLRPAVSVPPGSTVRVTGDPAQGSWVVNQDNSVTFTPADDFVGTATATLTVTAPNGTVATAELSATVTMVPAVADASGEVPQGQSVVLRPQLSFPPGSTIRVTGNPAQGAWVVNPDRSVTFTPADGFVGTANATIQITGPDGLVDTARLTVEVTMVPTAQGAIGSVPAGSPVTLTPQIVAPDGSTVRVVGDPAQGAWTVNPDRSVTFVPAPGFSGRATATLTVTAPNGTTATTDLAVNVSAAPSSPSPSGPSSPSPSGPSSPSPSGPSDQTPAVTGATGSGPAGEPVVLRPSLTIPDGATVTVVGDDPSQGVWEYDPDTGEVVFVPADGFTGRATATITVTGPDGATASAQLATNVLPTGGDSGDDSNPSDTDGTDGSGGSGQTGSPVGTGGMAVRAGLPAALGALVLLAGLAAIAAHGVAAAASGASARRRRT